MEWHISFDLPVVCKGSPCPINEPKRRFTYKWYNYQRVKCHPNPCFIIDGAASGVTKIRDDVTFPLLTLHRGKYHLSKRKLCLYRRPADFSYEKPMRYRTLCLMHDDISIKSYQTKWVILGQELIENNLETREFGHNARSLVAGSPLNSRNWVSFSQTSFYTGVT
jgi:hypothetical protein